MNEKFGQKWMLTEMWDDLWLATKYDAVYGTNGAAAIAAHPNATSKHLGYELDLNLAYKADAHITYGLGMGHIFTGNYLNEATNGKDYTYPFTYVTYVF
jgi:uncharacterized membrane protein